MKRQGGSWVIHIPSRKQNLMQVRPAGQAGYPISLVASLDTVPVKCCVPLHKWLETLVEQTTNKSKKQTEGSFTSVQMVHTHASLPRGFFSDSQAVRAIIRSLKRKWLQNTGKNHLLN